MRRQVPASFSSPLIGFGICFLFSPHINNYQLYVPDTKTNDIDAL